MGCSVINFNTYTVYDQIRIIGIFIPQTLIICEESIQNPLYCFYTCNCCQTELTHCAIQCQRSFLLSSSHPLSVTINHTLSSLPLYQRDQLYQLCPFIRYQLYQLPHLSEIIGYLSVCARFQLTSSRIIHVVTNDTISFFLKVYAIFYCVYRAHFLYSFKEELLKKLLMLPF